MAIDTIRRRFYCLMVVGGIAFLFFLWLLIVRPSFCPPQKNEWTAQSYQYSGPYNYGADGSSYVFAEKKQTPKNENASVFEKYKEGFLGIVCGELKVTDLALVIFTYCLVVVGWYTAAIDDATAKRTERAYIYGGGPYGELREDREDKVGRTRKRASYYKAPWCMALYNYGKTPGTLTNVEWGLIDYERFPKGKDVRTILQQKEDLLPEGIVKKVRYPNFICPPTDNDGLYYRHVDLPERKVGDVFFALIEYRDVFGESHWSTFKLRFTKDHSDPIEGGYTEDYGKPPEKANSA